MVIKKLLKQFVFSLLVILMVGQSTAQEDPAIATFKSSFEKGDYQSAFELGHSLHKAYPEDDIIRWQYAAAGFLVGDYRAVVAAADLDTSIPALVNYYETKETMGFDIYSWLLWKKQAIATVAYCKAYNKCDWQLLKKHLSELVALSPQDIDNYAILVFTHMIQGQWVEAGKVFGSALKNVPWNTNNVLCLRLYRPILHLLLNEQEQYRASLADLKKQDMPPSWKRTAEMIENPALFEQLTKEFTEPPDTLCMILSTRALLAEIQGDYILAESLYMRLITEDQFFKFLEYYLADARLKIIAPLAALQRINELPAK